jgi:outer membrane protein assembly factor BamB
MKIVAHFACPMLARLGKLVGLAAIVALAFPSERVTGAYPNDSNWPGFRGPGSRGVAVDELRGTERSDAAALEATLPDRWSATENVAWAFELPGRGWSSPVVWGDRVFLTTVVNAGEMEEAKKGLYFGGERTKPPEAMHQWKVFCLDLESGEVRWERTVHEGQPQSSMHIKNSFASETPTTDGQRVYCCFGNLGLFCFDFEGNEVWRRDLKPVRTRLGWGPAASPVLHEGRLYFCNDNEEESFMFALDASTGTELWRVPRDEKSNWSTPFVWKHDQRTEIVTLGSSMVRSYDLDGQVLWTLQGMSSITIATPYEADGLLYISSGYVMDKRRPIYAIRPGAVGDISLSEGQTSNEWIAWSQPQAAPYNPSTLVYDGRLYVLHDRGLLACYDASDGRELYSKQRLPNGRAFTSSPWAYDGKVFCLNEDGMTFVIKAGDEFELMHVNRLSEDDMGMASPAIVGDRLLIRTAARLYCIHDQQR